MPIVYKHPRAPEPWVQFRDKAPHQSLLPFYYMNWLGARASYFLAQWSIFELLEYVGSCSILLAVIFYFAGAGDRLKQKHYQAWQVINTAQGKGGSGGRVDALQELNADHVPLVGVDVSDAYLQDVKLMSADLRRGKFNGADMKNAVLRRSNLEGATMNWTNLRSADLSMARLDDVDLSDADLNGAHLDFADMRGINLDRTDLRKADLAHIKDWRQISSIRNADLLGVQNAPEGFIAWARSKGGVEIENDAQWNIAIIKAASTQPHDR